MELLYLHDIPVSSRKANVIQVLQMCHALSKIGISVTLAIPNGGEKEELIKNKITQIFNKKLDFSIIPYHKISLVGKFSMVGGYFGIRNILNRVHADCCFVRNPLFINATKKKFLPTFFESHNSSLHNKYKILNSIWTKNLIKNSKSEYLIKFICISNELAEVWRKREVPSNKIMVLHDGVDSEAFSSLKDVKTVRKELNLPQSKKIVMYSGSLYPDRGIENILNLAKIFNDVLFVVIGGTEERKNYYINLSKKSFLNNIMFLGYIPNYQVKDYLASADVLLMIWTQEVKTINYCSPLKMFEYMASGKIIVGHAFPTIKEVLKDGDTALLADPKSFEDLTSKLRKALSQNYPNSMAQKARKLALDNYSWEQRAKAIMDSLDYKRIY